MSEDRIKNKTSGGKAKGRAKKYMSGGKKICGKRVRGIG